MRCRRCGRRHLGRLYRQGVTTMKKSTKITLILAAILMLTGGIMALVCMVLGADWDDLELYLKNPFKQEEDWKDSFDIVINSDNADTWTFDDERIVGLDLDIEAGTLVIQYSEDNKCNVIVENGRKGLRCEVKKGILTIEENDSIHTLLDWKGDETPYVVVTLPGKVIEEGLLQSVQISVGAGNVVAKSLVSKSVQVDVDAGAFACEGLWVRGHCDIDVDAGSVTIENGCVEEGLQIDIDAGQVSYGGVLQCDWQVEVDAGSVTMDLDGSMMDHNYQIQYDLGQVQVGDKVFEGLSDTVNLKHGASNYAQIQCSMGQVNVSFSK